MKKIYLFLIGALASGASAQVPNLLWAKQAFPNGSYLTAMTTDYNNNIYIAGVLQTTIDADFGPGTYTLAATAGNGTNDFFIAKYDPNGNFIQAKAIDAYCSPVSISVDKYGGVALTGVYYVNGDFDPSATVVSPSTGGYQSAFVAHYNSAFNLKWAKAFNADLSTSTTVQTPPNAYQVMVDSSALGVYICGDFMNDVWVNGLPSSTAPQDPLLSYKKTAYVSKLDSNGNVLYSRMPLAYPAITAVGSTKCMAFTPGQFTYYAATQAQSTNSLAMYGIFDQYNPNGTSVQTKNINPTTGTTVSTFFDIKSLNILNNHIVFSGLFRGSYDWDPSPTTSTVVASTFTNQNEMFFAAYTFPWVNKHVKKLGTNSTPNPQLMAGDMDSKKNLLLHFRMFNGTSVDVDPSAASNIVATTAGACVVLAQYDSLGNYKWHFKLDPGPGMGSVTNLSAIRYNKVNEILTTGITYSVVDLDPTAATYTMANPYHFVAKYANPNGATAGFIPTYTTICAGSCITFTDVSTNSPSAWSWTLTGAATPTSNVQNPTVCYPAGGTYTVKLGTLGTPNSTVQSVIYVKPLPAQPAVINGQTSVCATSVKIYSITPISGATSYSWNLPAGWTGSSNTTSISVTIGPSTNTISVTANNACGAGAAQILTITVMPVPTQPTSISGLTSICVGGPKLYSVSPVAGATSYTWSLPAGWSGSSTTNSITGTPGSSGIMSVTASNSCGASPAQTISVTVNALPTVTIVSTPTVICAGNSSTLTSSGASTYTWNTGPIAPSIVVSPSATTNYTVTGTDVNGCVNTAVKSLSVNSNPTVNITGPSTSCSGSTLSLLASGATTYSWNTGPTTSSIVVSPTANVTYTVIGTTNGCTTTAVKSLTVNPLPTVSVTGPTVSCAGNSVTLSASGAATYTWNTTATTSSIIVTPTTSVVYTVNGTDANGCVGAAVKSLSVNPLPNVTISGSNTLCLSSTIILTGSGANTYSWSTSATTNTIAVSPATTTTYSLTGTDLNGCSKTVVQTVSVFTTPGTPTSILGPATVCIGSPQETFSVNPVAGATNYIWTLPSGWTGSSSTSSIQTVPTASGGTLTVIASNGCGSSPAQTLNVSTSASPTVSVVANPSVTCSGNPVLITASGASTYSWNTSATTSTINPSPAATTVYTVTGSNAAGCKNIQTITIGVFPSPTLNVSSTSSILCIGQTATLSVSGASTYSWNPGGAGSSIVVNPSSNTTYTIIGTGSNGCVSTVIMTQTVSNCSGIQDRSADNSIRVYPNPTNGEFAIELNTFSSETRIELYSVTGQFILEQKINSTTNRVNIQQLANGIYILKIKERDSVIRSEKIIKE